MMGLTNGLFAAFLVASSGFAGLITSAVAMEQQPDKGPYIINLRREVVPVYRNNEVVSYKTSHSGILHIGNPQQDFRVVFDTGSGHVVLPSSECKSEACLEHKRYSVASSPGAVAINVDGSKVPRHKLCDQVTIGFGTGSVTGEFVREKVCIMKDVCITQNMVMAVEMSVQPFKSFAFDGILGLGLSKLSLSPAFSFLTTMQDSGKVEHSHFGVFLSEGENGEESEISLGGANTARYHGPLRWAAVAKPQMGHWQVAIKAVRIGNVTLSACLDGSCRGIVDTGTSHLGIPGQHVAEAAEILTVPVASHIDDCRMAEGLTVEIDLDDFTLVLYPKNYMRRLPLRDGVNVGSTNGVSLAQDWPASSDDNDAVEEEPQGSHGDRKCKPRVMPVNLPPPLGPNLFLLGEPVLSRYYTVYGWGNMSIGFGMARPKSEGMMHPPPQDDGFLKARKVPEQPEVVLL